MGKGLEGKVKGKGKIMNKMAARQRLMPSQPHTGAFPISTGRTLPPTGNAWGQRADR